MKPYGKQTIFVFKQHDVLDCGELDDMDGRIKTIQASLDEKRKELKRLTQEQQELESSPPTADLQGAITRLNAENQAARASLEPPSESSAAPVSRAEADQIDKSWVKWRKEWTARRRIYTQLIGALEDGGANRAQLEEEKGIEHDDDDAKEVEESELCKPAMTQRPRPARQARTSQVLGKRPHGSVAAGAAS
ncbi:hypothetical protein A1Q1_00911 [Trichosporon asahii var. asahii CBS 2479]|uniref:Homologous-pairing protein 2 winged helix domain-containing protein n=1 Tax=Trichosporon asahii var. asahii (strain ATCC 90039 / CBS 2479 / JCM 2466 / KCTC 7840 / NBRC 103889/ NCYC 2677 / UAMH 7654) TaxID=1186058 RepID=J5QZB3_TRIAS|nr:hypothetical protein A1Q1_00911 [Trichosporon asahii var. asahii CBS 2479]EJT49898.1 hypothetical protein A1Q1_00911 [Trichosporon asahii var. asahii CBS 2479]